MPTKLLCQSLPQQDRVGRKEDGKNLVGQDKVNLIKQKQMLHVEAKENKIYSPLPGSRASSSCSGYFRRQMSQ